MPPRGKLFNYSAIHPIMVVKREYKLAETPPRLTVATHKQPLSAVNSDSDSGSPPTSTSPVEKKKLKRWSPLGWIKSSSESDAKKSQDGETSPKPILRSGKRCLSVGSKHVGFSGDVRVHQWNEEGQHVSTEQCSLCCEPKDREAFLHRNMMRIMAKENIDNGAYLHVTPDTDASEANVTLTFIPDTAQGITMKMVVSVGSRFKPDDLCVKANMNGNRLRIMAMKESPEEAGKMESFNERFSLPLTIDPYAVQARLDLKGNLTIEAPVVSDKNHNCPLKQSASVS